MKLIRRILALLIAVVAVLFAVSNRGAVTLGLWPLPFVVDVPVYLAVLGAGVIGFLFGGLVAWSAGGRWRRRARDLDHAVTSTRQDLAIARREIAKKTAKADPAPAGNAAVLPAVPREGAGPAG